jgi:molecular chaperone DnaK
MSEHAEQLDQEDKAKLQEKLKALREVAVKGQAGDASVTAEGIKEIMDDAQNSSLKLFQKVYEKANEKAQAEGAKSETPEAEVVDEKPKKD